MYCVYFIPYSIHDRTYEYDILSFLIRKFFAALTSVSVRKCTMYIYKTNTYNVIIVRVI